MPWPSATPGGARSLRWGGYVKLWVRAALLAGNTFHMGAHTYDRLDAGNVLGAAPTVGALDSAAPFTVEQRLWYDLSCDVMDLEIAGGSSSAQGIFSRPDAATCVVTLADPTGQYDPLSPSGAFAYGGRSRLVPGVPVQVFAEVVNGDTGAVTTHVLFTGTAESWGEDWTPRPSSRRARLTAVDVTKQWVRWNRPEQTAQGAGDTIAQRIARLVAFYGWTGTVEGPATSTATLAATTLAQSAWELLNRTLDDELGYVYFTPDGKLRWVNRDAWTTTSAPVIVLGCESLENADRPTIHDVLVDASPGNLDYQLRNLIYAARTGGTTQTALSQSSRDRYGDYEYKRTDLGLNDDAQVAAWAAQVLTLYAYPQVQLEDVTFHAAISPRSWEVWNVALPIRYVSDVVRIVWAPPDRPEDVVDGLTRVVGQSHRITRAHWETKWQLVAAKPLTYAGVTFHMGAHAQDRLNAGNVLAFAH